HGSGAGGRSREISNAERLERRPQQVLVLIGDIRGESLFYARPHEHRRYPSAAVGVVVLRFVESDHKKSSRLEGRVGQQSGKIVLKPAVGIGGFVGQRAGGEPGGTI